MYTSLAIAISISLLLLKLGSTGLRPKSYPPGPPTLPIIGNLHQLSPVNFHLQLQQWAKEYGPIFSLKLGGQTLIVLNTDKAVKDLLDKRGAMYSTRLDMFIREYDELNILIRPNDDTWKRLRRMYQHYLNPKAADHYIPYQSFESLQLLFDLQNNPTDFGPHLKRYVTSFASTIVYGWRTPSCDSDAVRILFQWLDRFSVAAGQLQVADWFPILRPIFRHWPSRFNSLRKELETLETMQETLYLSLLENVKATLQKQTPISSFCRDMLLNKVGNEKLSHKEVAFNAGQAWGGATDTTYNTLKGFVKAMLLFPEVQEAAQSEIDKVIGPNRLPEWNDWEKLPYVRCCVKETLRWLPTTLTGGMPHASTKDDEYMGYTIPAGAGVINNVWTINNDSKRAPDPRDFNPLRYKDDTLSLGESAVNSDASKRDQFTFGAGRRLCPGIHVAERGLFLAYTRILWAFKISRTRDSSGTLKYIDRDAVTAGFLVGPVPFECEILPRSRSRADIIRQKWNTATEFLDEEKNYSPKFYEQMLPPSQGS